MIQKANGLETLLAPRSVAVVGASNSPDKVGGRPLAYLKTQGFTGNIYAINPRAETVQGEPAYASLDALPEVPEVAILCIGAALVPEQLELCARLGVANVVLFASGFAEVGEEGRKKQAELVEICKRGNVRLLGPNAIGCANFHTGAILSFASVYTDIKPKPGPIAIVSQSGAIGVSAYTQLRGAGWGVGYVCTSGNEADLETVEFIESLADRDNVGIILLYLEDVKDPARLKAALNKARANNVPVVALRAGGTDRGVISAGWHTGSKGSAAAELDPVFDDSGCRTVQSFDALVESVPLYLGASWTSTSLGDSARVAIVNNSGAGCVLAVDEAVRQGIEVASLSAKVETELESLLPDFSRSRNPADLTAMLLTAPELLSEVVDTMLSDASVTALCLGLFAIGGPSYDPERYARDTKAVVDRLAKPLVFYSPHVAVREKFADEGHAVFPNEKEALLALTGFFAHREKLTKEKSHA